MSHSDVWKGINNFPLASFPDFDECSHEGHHDCSDNARCINQPGTYTCECKDGFVDSSDEVGRSCLGNFYFAAVKMRDTDFSSFVVT